MGLVDKRWRLREKGLHKYKKHRGLFGFKYNGDDAALYLL